MKEGAGNKTNPPPAKKKFGTLNLLPPLARGTGRESLALEFGTNMSPWQGVKGGEKGTHTAPSPKIPPPPFTHT